MNPSYKCDTHLGEAELLSWGFLRALHPEDRVRYSAQRQEAVSQLQPYEIEYRLLAADGSYHWFIEQATPVLGEDGKIQDWLVTCTLQDQRQPELSALLAQRTQDESLKALQESEERYHSLVIAISEIVWTTDPEGWVDDMPAWRAYTGQNIEQVKGWSWIDAVHPEDRDRTAQIWNNAISTKSLYNTEYRLRAADGSYRYFSDRGVPVLAEDGSIREWVGICTDIHEHKAAEAALKHRAEELTYLTAVLAQTNAALERRNQELDQFAYVASHDLKAPLRAIANLSEWIEEDISDTLNQENRHQMNLLRGRVHRMEALIDGLLQYSRVGRIATEAEPVNVTNLVVEVLNVIAPPPEFTITLKPGMPTLVTQRLPLLQVFSNLIGNGIKHHHRTDGQVTISVKDQGRFYEFAVADDGPGIAPQYHEKVFAIFQTLHARDRVENTGIGLAIVKKIVESQGGRIRLESEEGQGATFYFTWSK
jgi:PAS domain S-box-containing protein